MEEPYDEERSEEIDYPEDPREEDVGSSKQPRPMETGTSGGENSSEESEEE